MTSASAQEPLSSPLAAEDPSDEPILAPVPSTSFLPSFRSASSLTPLVCDERAIGRLLGTILARSGVSIHELARRLGCNTNVIRQYIAGRRSKPSLFWFVKVADACGAKVTVEFPPRR